MRNRDAEFGSHDAACHGRVHIADDDDRINRRCFQPRLERSHDSSRLYSMSSTADTEVDVGLRKPEHLEEAAGHRDVVVLAGVHQERLDPACDAGAKHRCHFHEVGTRTSYNGNALHRDLQSSLIVSHMNAVLPTR